MITQEQLKELLHYDPETGVFTWRVDRQRVHAGMRAGNKHKSGYTHIEVDGEQYKAHRLAWLYCTGRMPADHIDHINRVRGDDRIANLREATRLTNARNRNPVRRADVQCNGVNFHKRMQRYQACIHFEGRLRHLGTFDNLFDAVAARRSAENRYWTASSVSQ